MIDGLVSGRIFGDPEQRRGKGDSPFVVAKLRAPTQDTETVLVNVIAFDDAAMSALLALRDGDAAALAGGLTPKVWTDKQGNARPALDMVALRVLTVAGQPIDE